MSDVARTHADWDNDAAADAYEIAALAAGDAAAALAEAVRRLDGLVANRVGDLGFIPEADAEINDASRDVIAAMKTHPAQGVWLAVVNRYDKSVPVLREWGGELVYNFGADCALPVPDADLERLLREREDAPYTGVADDARRLALIDARARAVGGERLIWS